VATDERPVGSGDAKGTEYYLAKVTVGEREPLNGKVHLAPYDPGWPAAFERIAGLVREALGDKALLLEHVGSTSVPDLSAKPVIDLVLAVSDSADEPSYVPFLEARGFALRIREPEWFGHRLLKTPGVRGNLHVFSAGCEEVDRMLTFRDWLRANEADRRRYEAVKHSLAARNWKYTQDYADAKSEVVQEILARARADRDAR